MDWLSPAKEFLQLVFPIFERLPAVRVVLAFVMVFFLPGFLWTFVVSWKINIAERLALSFGISVALVTLSLLFVSRVVKFTGTNSVIVILGLIVLPLVIYYINRFIRQRRRDGA
ncbi:MAG: hypothetical protein HY665_04310 [Chloroflexi bacterium]|nr:hypothetical protein [Chloroflexota bacterium]